MLEEQSLSETEIQKARFEKILGYGSKMPIGEILKPNDFDNCKYGRFEQLIWTAYQLIYHNGKMSSHTDENGRGVTFVDDIEKLISFLLEQKKR